MAQKRGKDESLGVMNDLYRSLQKPERRRLLFQLVETDPREGLVVPESVYIGEKDLDRLDLELTHSHLPMLEEMGFIQWDESNQQVYRGPKLPEIRPVIRALRDEDPTAGNS